MEIYRIAHDYVILGKRDCQNKTLDFDMGLKYFVSARTSAAKCQKINQYLDPSHFFGRV